MGQWTKVTTLYIHTGSYCYPYQLAMAYYINDLESEVSGRGREGPPITQYPYYTKNLGKV